MNPFVKIQASASYQKMKNAFQKKSSKIGAGAQLAVAGVCVAAIYRVWKDFPDWKFRAALSAVFGLPAAWLARESYKNFTAPSPATAQKNLPPPNVKALTRAEMENGIVNSIVSNEGLFGKWTDVKAIAASVRANMATMSDEEVQLIYGVFYYLEKTYDKVVPDVQEQQIRANMLFFAGKDNNLSGDMGESAIKALFKGTEMEDVVDKV